MDSYFQQPIADGLVGILLLLNNPQLLIKNYAEFSRSTGVHKSTNRSKRNSLDDKVIELRDLRSWSRSKGLKSVFKKVKGNLNNVKKSEVLKVEQASEPEAVVSTTSDLLLIKYPRETVEEIELNEASKIMTSQSDHENTAQPEPIIEFPQDDKLSESGSQYPTKNHPYSIQVASYSSECQESQSDDSVFEAATRMLALILLGRFLFVLLFSKLRRLYY